MYGDPIWPDVLLLICVFGLVALLVTLVVVGGLR